MVTCHAPSSLQLTPGVCVEQVSCAPRVDSMQAHVGEAAHCAGVLAQVYAVGGVLPSANAMPGGWTSQNWSPAHVVVPHANGPPSPGGFTVQAQPSPSFCQVAGDPVHSHT